VVGTRIENGVLFGWVLLGKLTKKPLQT